MHNRRGRVLVVDNPTRSLLLGLADALAGHEVEVARDAFDAIYRIDCAGPAHDVIFCDLSCDQLPGPELWAFLGLSRTGAAQRMVFVASSPLRPETRAFLERVPNLCVNLPADAEAVDALVARRSGLGPRLARASIRDDAQRPSAPAKAEGA